MTSSVHIEITGDSTPVDVLLSRVEAVLSIPGTQVWLTNEVLPYIKQRASSRFSNEGDDVSGRWPQLSATTIEIRESQGFGSGPINVRTGELERYITGSPGVVNGRVLTYPDHSPGSGTDGYLEAKIMTAQEGRANPRTPPRPVLGLNENDLAFAVASLATFIASAGNGTGTGAGTLNGVKL